MKFPEIPELFQFLFRLFLLAALVYYYVYRRNKKQDPEKVHLYQVIGASFFGLVFVSTVVAVIVYHDNPSARDQVHKIIMWTAYPLLVLAALYIEYRFWRRKKQQNNQPGLNP